MKSINLNVNVFAFVITFANFIVAINSYRILCPFPTISHSHFIVIEPLLIALAEKGHHVTVIGPHPPKQPIKNYRYIINQRSELHSKVFEKLTENPGNLLHAVKAFPIMTDFSQNEMRTMLANEDVQNIMENEKFDLVIIEGWVADPLFGLGQHFNCPIVEFSSIKANDYFLEQFSNPLGMSYAANIMLEYRAPLSFKHRLFNILFYFVQTMINLYSYTRNEQLYNELFPQPKYYTYAQARKNVSAIFVTQHFTELDIKPMLPYIIEVSGIHLKDSHNPLPFDLQKWMDESDNGVVFMSLGSNMKCSSLPKEKLHHFLSVFQQLKENVLWKCETDQLGEIPKNVKIMKWVPQSDILQHRNLKIFITHGGLGSVTEAKYYAVPLVVIPMFTDQIANGFSVDHEKWGVRVPYKDLTAEKLYRSIRDVVDNRKYRDEAKYRSMLFRDRPMTALETAIYWTEYIIRHRGAKHMQPNSRHLNFVQLHSLDVITFLALVIIVTLYIGYRILKYLLVKCVKKYKTD